MPHAFVATTGTTVRKAGGDIKRERIVSARRVDFNVVGVKYEDRQETMRSSGSGIRSLSGGSRRTPSTHQPSQ